MKELANYKGSVRDNFDKIYILYYSRMHRFAKEYVILNEDAENIVQDVFVILWEKREVLEIKVSLISYLFSLVKNKCMDYLRHKLIEDKGQEELSAKLYSLELMDQTFSSEEEIEQIINSSIAKLPERCRKIFIKSHIEGKKYREIAEELNISVNTVENQISIALKKLRVLLKDYLPLLFFLSHIK
ncbi:RNA polymerase sigma-70 factor [Parabacteroides sp. Marseille-P3160]|uniref:RNA polymerase sigma-70 factor n=1 Tax=Parabacteroides sp. Marseille-P3160 TaxID=1917887 RepID=UPI0009BAA227|nr:RNA polymerase sigma-70 factor [Parabacteroides sp. Marseille-P3160]